MKKKSIQPKLSFLIHVFIFCFEKKTCFLIKKVLSFKIENYHNLKRKFKKIFKIMTR